MKRLTVNLTHSETATLAWRHRRPVALVSNRFVTIADTIMLSYSLRSNHNPPELHNTYQTKITRNLSKFKLSLSLQVAVWYDAPADFVVAAGVDYPLLVCSCGEVMPRFTDRCVGYDADLHYGEFDIEGETGRQVDRLLAGLPVALPGHKTERLGSESGQLAEPAAHD
jgi:hypothetical protein